MEASDHFGEPDALLVVLCLRAPGRDFVAALAQGEGG